jgi:hypothetical protein
MISRGHAPCSGNRHCACASTSRPHARIVERGRRWPAGSFAHGVRTETMRGPGRSSCFRLDHGSGRPARGSRREKHERDERSGATAGAEGSDVCADDLHCARSEWSSNTSPHGRTVDARGYARWRCSQAGASGRSAPPLLRISIADQKAALVRPEHRLRERVRGSEVHPRVALGDSAPPAARRQRIRPARATARPAALRPARDRTRRVRRYPRRGGTSATPAISSPSGKHGRETVRLSLCVQQVADRFHVTYRRVRVEERASRGGLATNGESGTAGTARQTVRVTCRAGGPRTGLPLSRAADMIAHPSHSSHP